jgi:Spy/CpxP family protein refolding chaperone
MGKKNLSVGSTIVISLIPLCLIFLVSACDPYYYPEPPRNPGPGPRADVLYNIERIVPELKLTKEQRQEIKKLRADFDKEAKRIDAALRAGYTDLNNLAHEDRKQLDKDGLFKKADEVSDLHAEMQRKILELDLALTDLLTDEQYKKFRAIVSKRAGDD